MKLWTGTRVHLAAMLLLTTIGVASTSQSTAAATVRTVVGGVERPTKLSETNGDAIVASDGAGGMYVTFPTQPPGSGLPYRIWHANAAGDLALFAGNGIGSGPGTGDGGPATAAGIGTPMYLTRAPSGAVYFFDGSRVRRISGGLISSVAGSGGVGPPTGDGGPATSAPLLGVRDLAVDSAENVYIVQQDRLRRVDAVSGVITSVVTGQGMSQCSGLTGPTSGVRFNGADSVAIDSGGLVYLAVGCFDGGTPSQYVEQIIKIDVGASTSSLFAGGGSAEPGNNGQATAARLQFAVSLAVGAGDTLFFTDYFRLRSITQAGVLATIAGEGGNCQFADNTPLNQICVGSVSLDGPDRYLVTGRGDRYAGIGRITNGVLDVLSAPPVPPDGALATVGPLGRLHSLASAPNGRLFYSTGTYPRVRTIETNGTVGTVIGNGEGGPPLIGAQATSSPFTSMSRLDVDRASNLYAIPIAESRVVRVGPDGILVNVAGTGSFGNGPDGGPATTTAIAPIATTTSPTGEVYILGRRTSPCSMFPSSGCPAGTVVRKVDRNGTITTSYVNTDPGRGFSDLAMAPDGTLVLVPATGTELLRLNPAQQTTTSIGLPPGFLNNTHAVLDSAGSIYLSNPLRLARMAPTLTSITQIDVTGVPNTDVALDAAGNLYLLRQDIIVKYSGVAAPEPAHVLTANDDAASVVRGNAVDIAVRTNDTVTTGALGVPVITSAPQHGTATVLGNGAVRYTAGASAFGSATFTYSLCSNYLPPSCDSATVTVTETAVPPSTSPPTSPPAATATAPGAPDAPIGAPGAGEVGLTWSAPFADGGSPITDYTVQASSDGGATWVTIAHPVSAATNGRITGLTNGVAYVFRVAAVNAVGTGPFSGASPVVVPVAPPADPAPLAPSLKVNDSTPTPGSNVTVRLSQLTPFEWVAVYLFSSPVLLGTFQADGNGDLNATVVLPADLAPGAHTITASGQTSGVSGKAMLDVVAADDGVANGTGKGFNPLSPLRVFDTRPSDPQGAVVVAKQKYGGGIVLRVKVTGAAGVPVSGVGAVSLNVTAVDPDGAGFVTVFPCGERPLAANLNYVKGQIVPNAVIAPVSAAGEVCFFSLADTHLIADVNGWFATGRGSLRCRRCGCSTLVRWIRRVWCRW